MRQRVVGYFVFDGVVLLEFAGPLQVFDVAGRVAIKRKLTEVHPFTSVVLSKTGAAVQSREGVTLGVQGSIASHAPLDMVIVPGGALQAELANAAVDQWLKKTSVTSEVTGSVCVGAFLLGQAGLLDGREATTHFDDTADLKAIAPKARVRADKVWVDEGRVVTSGGFAAGIDMALHLVSRFLGEELAAETARQLEYPRRQVSDRRY
jgi:transcriptional regulator GlxA family with amidase domain